MTPGFYRHYKGGMYELLSVGIHTETKEELAIYKNEKGQTFVRPLELFKEKFTFVQPPTKCIEEQNIELQNYIKEIRELLKCPAEKSLKDFIIGKEQREKEKVEELRKYFSRNWKKYANIT